MTIQHFDRDLGAAAVGEDFRNKKLHIVCVALNGLTIYNAFATVNGFSSEEAGQLTDRVNTANETGTLWPRLALTIVPLTRHEERDDFGNREVMRRHIKDALLAHSQYIKSEELLFAFEGSCDFDHKLAKEILWEETQAFCAENTRAIYYIPE